MLGEHILTIDCHHKLKVVFKSQQKKRDKNKHHHSKWWVYQIDESKRFVCCAVVVRFAYFDKVRFWFYGNVCCCSLCMLGANRFFFLPELLITFMHKSDYNKVLFTITFILFIFFFFASTEIWNVFSLLLWRCAFHNNLTQIHLGMLLFIFQSLCGIQIKRGKKERIFFLSLHFTINKKQKTKITSKILCAANFSSSPRWAQHIKRPK